MLKARKIMPPRKDFVSLTERERLPERAEAVAKVGYGLGGKIIIQIRRQQAAVDVALL